MTHWCEPAASCCRLLVAGLEGTQRMLDAQRLEQAVEALHKARKIVFVGVGGGAAICDEAAHMFLKAGFDASSYRDGYTQTIIAAKLGPEDVMVGISHTGTTMTVADAMLLARDNGATTIAITSDAQSDVAKAGNVCLTTWGCVATSHSTTRRFSGRALEPAVSDRSALCRRAVPIRRKDGQQPSPHRQRLWKNIINITARNRIDVLLKPRR